MNETETTRATAGLPGLDIEARRQRTARGDAEWIPIDLRAAPSVAAFRLAFEAADLFTFWAQSATAAWRTGRLPWLEAAGMMEPSTLPWALAPAPPSGVETHAGG